MRGKRERQFKFSMLPRALVDKNITSNAIILSRNIPCRSRTEASVKRRQKMRTLRILRPRIYGIAFREPIYQSEAESTNKVNFSDRGENSLSQRLRATPKLCVQLFPDGVTCHPDAAVTSANLVPRDLLASNSLIFHGAPWNCANYNLLRSLVELLTRDYEKRNCLGVCCYLIS